MQYIQNGNGKKIGFFDRNLTTPVIGERCFLAIMENGEECIIQTSKVQDINLNVTDGSLTLTTLYSIYKGHVNPGLQRTTPIA